MVYVIKSNDIGIHRTFEILSETDNIYKTLFDYGIPDDEFLISTKLREDGFSKFKNIEIGIDLWLLDWTKYLSVRENDDYSSIAITKSLIREWKLNKLLW